MSPPGAVAADVECVWPARAQLGESPCWDQRAERLVWIDIEGPRLHAFSPAERGCQTWELGARLCSLDVPSLGWEPPAALRGQPFVGCGDQGLGWIGLGDDDVDLIPIGDPERDLPHNRYNDGKMGPDGRYWAGTMHEAEVEATGNLYAFRPDGEWSVLDRGYAVANGPAFSDDGTIVYHADSAARTIYAFDLCADGALSGKRTFVRFEEEEGYPDGMSVGSDGNLWVAMWDGGRLEAIEPTGARRGVVELPVQRPTSCVFTESDSQHLFVTSARRGLQGEDPAPGGLFSVHLR